MSIIQPDPVLDRAEQRRAMLAELADIGMELARLMRSEALEAAKAGPVAADLGLGFSRIARAVRQTLALEARFAEDGLSLARRIEDGRRAEAAAQALGLQAERRRQTSLRRAQLIDIVDGAIAAEHGDSERAESLREALSEWLFDDRDDELADTDRPIGEIVLQICRALGVTLDPDVWADLDPRPAAAASSPSTPPGLRAVSAIAAFAGGKVPVPAPP